MSLKTDNIIEIEIINWEKYNPRNDRTIHLWFRFENSFFSNPKLWDLNDAQRLLFIFILCEGSKIQKSTVQINLDYIAALRKKTVSSIVEDLKVLAHFGGLSPRFGGLSPPFGTPTVQDSTIQNNTIQSCASSDAGEFDLENLYKKYPRKLGKSLGMKKLKSQIKTHDDGVAVDAALAKFIEYHTAKGTETNFLPYFSTWVSSWRDWIDHDVGSVVGLKEMQEVEIGRIFDEVKQTMELANGK